MSRIPKVYQDEVLALASNGERTIDNDPNCLMQLKNYRSLMPMAMQARKPIFELKYADGQSDPM